MGEKKYEHFMVSIIVVLFYPLIPIMAEWGYTQHCLLTTLTLTTAVYSVTVFTTSNKLPFLLGAFIPAMFFTVLYTRTLNSEVPSTLSPASKTLTADIMLQRLNDWPVLLETIVALLAIAIIHGCERWRRHVIQGEPFYQPFQ